MAIVSWGENVSESDKYFWVETRTNQFQVQSKIKKIHFIFASISLK